MAYISKKEKLIKTFREKNYYNLAKCCKNCAYNFIEDYKKILYCKHPFFPEKTKIETSPTTICKEFKPKYSVLLIGIERAKYE